MSSRTTLCSTTSWTCHLHSISICYTSTSSSSFFFFFLFFTSKVTPKFDKKQKSFFFAQNLQFNCYSAIIHSFDQRPFNHHNQPPNLIDIITTTFINVVTTRFIHQSLLELRLRQFARLQRQSAFDSFQEQFHQTDKQLISIDHK